MKLVRLTPSLVDKYRHIMIKFIQNHGDKRITKEALQWIRNTKAEQVYLEGTAILVALEEKNVIGLVVTANYGIDESFIVVHKQFRSKDVGKQMVHAVVSQLNKIYCRIATDNIPSLKICLDNDMVAFHLFTGPTGKPTLWLGGGAWSKADVLL